MTVGVVAVLLAAGRSERFGAAKLVTPLRDGSQSGVALGVAALRNLLAAGLRVIAVVRPGDAVLAREMRTHGARLAIAEHADAGIGASLAAGAQAAPPGEGLIVALADMPWIAPATIAGVAAAVAEGAALAAPFYRGRRGHPVGFSPGHRPALEALTGDEGAWRIVDAHAHRLLRIDVEDAGVLRDVDRPADL